MSPSTDTVFRAISDDGSFRVVTAQTTVTAREILDTQRVEGATAELLADLVTSAVLVRETMAPQLRVQAILLGAGRRGSVVADAHPDGMTRGLVELPPDGTDVDVRGGALLQMMRSLPNGTLHRGVVTVPSDGGISEAVMTYMLESEQVVSMISVGSVFEGGALVAAGGYVVQLLPELGDAALRSMIDRLQGLASITALLRSDDRAPRRLTERLLEPAPFTALDETALRFGCHCSQVRVLSSLATLSQAEIQSLLDDGQTVEIACDYCRKDYLVEPEQLRALLTTT